MEFPDRAGVMILEGACLFPQALQPLFIFEPRYRRMLEESLDGHRMFVIAMARPGIHRESPLPVAGLGLVRASVQNEDGTSNLLLQGLTRVRLGKVTRYKPFREMVLEPIPEAADDSLVIDALLARVLDLVEMRLSQGTRISLALIAQITGAVSGPLSGDISIHDCMAALRRLENPGQFADMMALLLLPNPLARQVILQTVNTGERLKSLIHFLLTEVARNRKDTSL